MNKYFPEAKAPAAKKEISAIEQPEDESLLDYLNRFQDWLVKCPNHQYNKENLVKYFCNGLLSEEADYIDTFANDFITKLDAEIALELIKEVAYK